MDIEEMISRMMKEAEAEFAQTVEKEMKEFNINGYNLFKEYENNLLEYWENGHGNINVLISEMMGFLSCLRMQKLIEESKYMYLADCFIEKLKKIKA